MAKTRAQENRAIRQEALREQLSNQKLVEHVVELAKKMEQLTVRDADHIAKKMEDIEGLAVSTQVALLSESVDFDLKKFKAAADINIKLIAKYLPDLRSTEFTGDPDNPIAFKGVSLERVTAAKSTDS